MAMTEIPDEEENIKPGLTEIPVLPSDYPLFSWDDWPDSRAALVPGTPTKFFAKETWNAIVDAINDALSIAGVDWYDPRLTDDWEPYTVDDSKILRPYGQLTAVAFNTVCDNVDIGTPSQWGWAMHEDFRGYVGRPRFKGTTITYDEDGAIVKMKYGDNVYPEYILELVRRVNLMLGLMRGTVPTLARDVEIDTKTKVEYKGVKSQPGVRIQYSYLMRSKISPPKAELHRSAISDVESKSKSLYYYNIEMLNAGGIAHYLYSVSLRQVSGAVKHGKAPDAEIKLIRNSSIKIDFSAHEQKDMSTQNKSFSIDEAKLDKARISTESVQSVSLSSNVITLDCNSFKPAETQLESFSINQVELDQKRRAPAVCTPISRTLSSVELFMAVIQKVRMYIDCGLFGEVLACSEPLIGIGLVTFLDLLVSAFAEEINPETVLLHTLDSGIYLRFGPQIDSSRKNIMYAVFDTHGANSNPKAETPCEIFLRNFIETSSIGNCPKIELPEEICLLTRNGINAKAEGLLQNPNDIILYLLVSSFFGLIEPKVQSPTVRYAHALEEMVNFALFKRSRPSLHMLLCVSDTENIVFARLDNPWSYQAYKTSYSYGCIAPSVLIPTDVSMVTEYEYGMLSYVKKQNPAPCLQWMSGCFSALASVDILRRIITQAYWFALLTSETDVKLTEIERIFLFSEDVLTAVANVVAYVRQVVSTRGSITENCSGVAISALDNPVDVRMQIAFQVFCSSITSNASAHIAIQTRGTAYIMPLQTVANLRHADAVAGWGYTLLDYDILAFGDVICTQSGFGVVSIPDIDSRGGSRTAIALNRSGQPIGIEIDVILGGTVGKNAFTCMHSVIQDVRSLAFPENAATRARCGHASLENIKISAFADHAATVRRNGSVNAGFKAVCGGSVRTARDEWRDPVRTGTNLYITYVQQSWNDGDKMYVDVGEFYDPIRNGSDLYIRSVNSSYADRNNVNIDMAFFLEPVREGTNLYIRQDIFGGE